MEQGQSSGDRTCSCVTKLVQMGSPYCTSLSFPAPTSARDPRSKAAVFSQEGGMWRHSLTAKSTESNALGGGRAENGAGEAMVINKKAGVTTCETAIEQGEKSQHRYRYQHHNHLLQIKKCPGGRVLGFGVSGLGVVLFIFWLLKTHQLILHGTVDSCQLCWLSQAFPFLGPGLNISIPKASSFPKLCFYSYFYSFIIILPFSWYRKIIHSEALEPQGCSTAFSQEEQGSTELL